MCPNGIDCVLIRNETPKGASVARNKGVKASTEEYIAFLDDDDLFLPSKLRVAKEFILKERADVYFHPYIANFSVQKLKYVVKPYSGIGMLCLTELLKSNFVGGTPEVIISKSIFERIGGFDTSFPAIEDYELWLRLMKFNAKFMYIPHALTLHNFTMSFNSLSKSKDKDFTAATLLEEKYSEDLSKLTKYEYRQYCTHKVLRRVYQAQMSGDNISAFWLNIKLGLETGSAVLVFKSFLYLLGLRCYILLASLFRFLKRK